MIPCCCDPRPRRHRAEYRRVNLQKDGDLHLGLTSLIENSEWRVASGDCFVTIFVVIGAEGMVPVTSIRPPAPRTRGQGASGWGGYRVVRQQSSVGLQGGGTSQEGQGSIPRQARCRLVVRLAAVTFKAQCPVPLYRSKLTRRPACREGCLRAVDVC